MHEYCSLWLTSRIVLDNNIMGKMSVFLLTYIKQFLLKIFHLRRLWMPYLQGVLYLNMSLFKDKNYRDVNISLM